MTNCPLCGEAHSNADMLGHIWECEDRRQRKREREEVTRLLAERISSRDHGKIGDLLFQLLSGSAVERIEAAYTLGCYGRPNRRRQSSEQLTARRLGSLKESELPIVMEALEQALEDEDREVRAEAARAFGKIKSPLAVDALLRTLADFNPNYTCRRCGRVESCLCLQEMRFPPRSWDTREPYAALPTIAAEALGSIGDPIAIPSLIAATRSQGGPKWLLRAEAVKTLGKLGKHESLPSYKKQEILATIESALDAKTYRVFLSAISALGDIGSPAAISLLEELYLSILAPEGGVDERWHRYAWFGSRFRAIPSTIEIIREAILSALYNSVTKQRGQGEAPAGVRGPKGVKYGISMTNWSPEAERQVPNAYWETAALRIASFLRARYEAPSTSSRIRSTIREDLREIDRHLTSWRRFKSKPTSLGPLFE